MKRTALLRRTPLRRVSAKRRSENMKYSRLRKAFLAGRPYCEACFLFGHASRMRSTEVHHAFGRGKYLNEVKTWFAVCNLCHTDIHSSPNNARKLGLLK